MSGQTWGRISWKSKAWLLTLWEPGNGGGDRGVEIKVYFPRACPQWPAAQTLSLDIHRILNSTNKWGQSFLTSKPVDFISKPWQWMWWSQFINSSFFNWLLEPTKNSKDHILGLYHSIPIMRYQPSKRLFQVGSMPHERSFPSNLWKSVLIFLPCESQKSNSGHLALQDESSHQFTVPIPSRMQRSLIFCDPIAIRGKFSLDNCSVKERFLYLQR